MLAKDSICSTMPSCLEAGQRAKLNRTCHSAQASLRSLLLEESCIRKNSNSNQKKAFFIFFQKSLNKFLPQKEMNIKNFPGIKKQTFKK
ncbi:hypothetical protein [Phascolarctobacterium sp.]